MGFLKFLLLYAAPCIAIGLLIVLWAAITVKLEYRFPRYFRLSQRTFVLLPKIGAVIIIAWLIYAFFTEPSYYDW